MDDSTNTGTVVPGTWYPLFSLQVRLGINYSCLKNDADVVKTHFFGCHWHRYIDLVCGTLRCAFIGVSLFLSLL